MKQLMQQLRRQISLQAARGYVTASDDSKKLQYVQVELLPGELRELARIQNYGLTSRPHKGAQLITLALKGLRQNSIVIACDDGRYRVQDLEEGEVALYTDEGDVVHFKRNRNIYIKTQKLEADCETAAITATESVDLKVGEDSKLSIGEDKALLKASNIKLDGAVEVTESLKVTDDITSDGDVIASGISLAKHEHPNGNNGSPTGAPI